VFARFLSFAFYAAPNAKIAFSHGIKNLLAELDEYQPSVLLGVPRVFEKVYNASSQKASKGAAKLVFKNAAKAAVAYSKALETPEGPSMKQKAARNAFVIPVYSKIRAALGGNIKYCVCGAAPLNTEINHFFRGAGITILEGYGLTETVAPVFVNRPTFNKVGTIGVPFPDVKLRISDDDELLLKSPSNMSGYHNLPSENKSALHNGWFHTGDLASVDEDGFVKIIGRKKDIIITAGGKNVTPSVLEKCIDENIIVQASLVVGDGRPFISALVALDVDELKGWAKKQDILQQITDQNGKILLEIAKDHPIIRAEIDRSVTEANKLVSQAESIRKYEILPEDFSEQNETYTPSMKVRRPQVIERYADIIKNEIYGKPRGK
jgi:long-chain acyl-CoA synthetase